MVRTSGGNCIKGTKERKKLRSGIGAFFYFLLFSYNSLSYIPRWNLVQVLSFGS